MDNIDKNLLIKMYDDEKRTCVEIANHLSVNYMLIYRKLKKFNIPIRSHSESLKCKKRTRTPKQIEQLWNIQHLPKTEKQRLVASANGKKSWRFNLPKATAKAATLPRTEKQKQASSNVGRIVGTIVCSRRGPAAIHWKGGITPLHILIRNLPENKIWRDSIFKRDNFTCVNCGIRGCELEAHHKKQFSFILSEFLQIHSQFSPIEDKETLGRLAVSYSPFWDIDNGETRCLDCHKAVRRVLR